MTDHLSGKELFIRFTASAFRKLLSIYAWAVLGCTLFRTGEIKMIFVHKTYKFIIDARLGSRKTGLSQY